MRWFHAMLVLAVVVAAAAPAPANIFGSKKNPVPPEQRVQELIGTAQTAAEVNKRVSAVEELREFSTATFPQIVPVLVDILHQDKAPSVRAEAAHSLGRIRPLTKMASDALSEAVQKDSSLRVRWAARTALTYFSVAGLNSNNYDPAEKAASKVKVSAKDGPVGGTSSQSLLPQPGTTVIIPGGAAPPNLPGYGLPMPKGPSGSSTPPPPLPPGPAATTPAVTPMPLPPGPTSVTPPLPPGSLTPTVPVTSEPPLPPALPVQGGALIGPPPSVAIPDVGPIAIPQ